MNMEDVVKIASYICARYQQEFGQRIDEMKLHKLLYLVQREAIIQRGNPMFSAQFEAWKYGPVLKVLHQRYRDDALHESLPDEAIKDYLLIFDRIFETYAKKSSWSLSTLTHGEYSWKKAREGYAADGHCEVEIKTDDIRIDAGRLKERREMLQLLGINPSVGR